LLGFAVVFKVSVCLFRAYFFESGDFGVEIKFFESV